MFFSDFQNFDFYNNGGHFDVFFYVCSRARGGIFGARNLIFWLRTHWDMSKKVFFSDFQNFDFYDNGGHFDVFFMSVRGQEVAFLR